MNMPKLMGNSSIFLFNHMFEWLTLGKTSGDGHVHPLSRESDWAAVSAVKSFGGSPAMFCSRHSQADDVFTNVWYHRSWKFNIFYVHTETSAVILLFSPESVELKVFLFIIKCIFFQTQQKQTNKKLPKNNLACPSTFQTLKKPWMEQTVDSSIEMWKTPTKPRSSSDAFTSHSVN